ncbi:MAG: spermidine synthase [Phycisphaerae bacterium]|nr:spermidine synthase [Phycisphaerae bacterium]
MSDGAMGTHFWINEHITPWDIYAHGVTGVLVHRKTAFQEMCIVETGAYGKALVLDGKWQSCVGDEFLYHEPLVHPAMLLHGAPRSVLILGGGEGATAREVLRWKTVDRAVMIDIDRDVVEACREFLPEMHRNCFDDPRLEVVIDDALDFLDGTKGKWDVIISDLSDPIEDGPSFKLFTKEYFEKARGVLLPDGVFVLQAGPVGPAEMGMHARLVRTMKEVFAQVQSYITHVPTYASPWGFALGAARPIDTRPDPAEIDQRLKENTTGGLRMLDGITLLGMFQLPVHLRRAIAEENRVYTLKEPPRFFGKGSLERKRGQAQSCSVR